jgi:GAF domain-containing protein
MTRPELTDALHAVARLLVADVPLDATLERVAVLARDALGPASAVGVTLLDAHDRPRTRVLTDEISPRVEEAQAVEGDGPSLHAARTGEVVRVDDVHTVAQRWPAFAREALESGVTSVLSVPLQVDDRPVGALSAYALSRSFTDEDAEAVAEFVRQAAVVVANARSYWEAHDLTVSLQAALTSRSMIDMAKGKIMAQNDCTPDEAFTLLVKASQRENVKLREIARRIVEGHTSLADTSGVA